jgi:hypothetical protein
MSINRPTVLILASDPAFAREITANWPKDAARYSQCPEFIVLDEGFSRDLEGSHYDLAIADVSSVATNASQDKNNDKHADDKKDDKKKGKRKPLRQHRNRDLKHSLAAAGTPAILINTGAAVDFYNLQGAVLELRREPRIWPAIAGLIGREILRRRQAESRAREAEKICAVAEAEATLGRYMVEMRTNINNALTTVLGNAELMVLEPGLPATVLAQADTIRNMALRLHEVFQRFSSLEKELTVSARESGKKALHTSAGSS